MKRNLISALAALCATAYADPVPDAAIVTDPGKIVSSTTYDLGERLMTIQELTKEALPVPPPALPLSEAPATAPRPAFQPQNRGTISVGATIYKRANQPTRSLIHYQIIGQTEPITFWSSADWSLIAGVGSLTAPDGKIWQLMCMPSIYDLDNLALRQRQAAPVIPDMPAGKATYQLVSGDPTPEQMAPIALYHAYYDAHLAELQAAQQARLTEQKRLAAENLAHPPEKEDITVQYRILAPEEIVTPEDTAKTLKK